MSRISKMHVLDAFWILVSLSAGMLVIYAGDRILNVSLEVFYGISTFNPMWAMSMILVPLLAGIVVSLIYGLGGKIIAHFVPIPVRIYQYIHFDSIDLPEGVTVLPFGYWILILIICVEAAGVGGFIGEVIVKKTYGRRPKHLIHKRYQVKEPEKNES